MLLNTQPQLGSNFGMNKKSLKYTFVVEAVEVNKFNKKWYKRAENSECKADVADICAIPDNDEKIYLIREYGKLSVKQIKLNFTTYVG